MDRLAIAAARLEQRRADYLATATTYCRERAQASDDTDVVLPDGVSLSAPDEYGNVVASVALNATMGATPFRQTDASGITVVDEHRDFLVLQTDLAPFWAVALGDKQPARGDYFMLISGSDELVFEVMSPGSEPVYADSGSHGQSWRIHTKRAS